MMAKNMQTQLENAEDVVPQPYSHSKTNSIVIVFSHMQMKIRLNTNENELLIAHTYVYAATCMVGFGAYVTGNMAMNLQNPFFYSDNSTAIVISTTTAIMIGGFICLHRYFEAAGIIPKKY